ncbi:metal-dependent transcriptional regulator [Thermodesulfobacteriota bacterium]
MARANEEIDEILEFIWTGKEAGSIRKEDLLGVQTTKVTPEIIEKLFDDDYIFEVKGEINLTEKGSEVARRLIRAHRLAERLFTDVLQIEKEPMELSACSLEHCLYQESLDAICTLLGHPKECPHGRQIPRGACCKRAKDKIDPVVLPLNRLKAGETGRIVYVSTKHHSRLDRLTDLGITPGEEVRVHQTFPAFVVKVRETDIAIDTDILKDVYVRRSNNG